MVKVVVGLVVLAVLAVLFVRSVTSTRAVPFVVERDHLSGWTLVQQTQPDPMGAWLAVSPPPQLAMSLGRDIFQRGGESVAYPSPALVPLLLQSEFDRAFAGTAAQEEIMRFARVADLDSMIWEPRCMAHRRVSEPGISRGVYFVIFNTAPFERFRQQVSEMLQASARASLFDPAALSPVLIVAGPDGDFGRWMPLRADPERDCLAPIEAT